MIARRFVSRVAISAAALSLLCFCQTAAAYTFGSPDATFGTGGMIRYTPPITPYAGINAMAVQPDGKIVVAGVADTTIGGWVARFSDTGVLDTSFGTNGVTAFNTPGFEDSEPEALAVQPDGKIVVAGTIENSGSGDQWRLVYRLGADGRLDTSSDSTPATCFGLSCLGYSLSFAATGDANYNDVEVLPSGDILAAGDYVDSGTQRPYLSRFTTDGTVDAVFNGNAATALGGFAVSSADPAHVRILRPSDGNFIFAFGNAAGSFQAVKLNSTGTTFSGFGNSGHWEVGASLGFADAVLRPNGNILFVGSQSAAPYQVLTLGGIDKDGETDASIGAGGISAVDIAGKRTNGVSVRVLADGRFFVLTTLREDASVPVVLTSVFTTNGQPDPTYGVAGTIRHNELGAYNYPTALELLPGDKPLIAGTLFDYAATTNFGFITKLHGPNDPDPPIVPAAAITSPAKSKPKFKAKKLLKFSGTATPAGQVAKVEIALQRVDSKLLKKKKRCLWLSSNRAKFKKVKAVKKKCSAPKWLTATGTGNWSYKLKKKLPKGSYSLQVRAIATDGNVQAKPTARKFKVS